MAAIDLRKERKDLYTPPVGAVQLVEVPPMNFLAIDGTGDPNTSQAYAEAVAALYAVAYAVKMRRKREDAANDYVVMPLEGLWWMADGAFYSPDARENWAWTMLIRQPDDVTAEQFAEARDEVAQKKGVPNLSTLRFENQHERRAVQTMHVGPYATEAPTIALLHDSIAAHGYRARGKHHEIYLSDPRRTAPEQLKTILRQPIEE
ncbi:MAG TPA: GyrI-like domain-containing protein [Thermomicrobiales bacterium]|jgi:hypothetical protein